MPIMIIDKWLLLTSVLSVNKYYVIAYRIKNLLSENFISRNKYKRFLSNDIVHYLNFISLNFNHDYCSSSLSLNT